MSEEKEEMEEEESEESIHSIHDDLILRESAYILCPTCETQFPRGAKCPKCS